MFTTNELGEIVCLKNMDVTFSSKIKRGVLNLILQFSNELDKIDFNITNINTLVYFYIAEID